MSFCLQRTCVSVCASVCPTTAFLCVLFGASICLSVRPFVSELLHECSVCTFQVVTQAFS
jgi:hypothetical protein